jgi:hypothetical protein
MRRKGLIAATVFSALVLGSPVHAELIPGFDLQANPDIGSGFITNNYNSTSNTFTASGFALTIDGNDFDTSGVFSITATIDEAGNASMGSLLIDGVVGAAGVGANMLLEGSLVDFGFPTLPAAYNTGPFQFLFQVTGGDLAGDFGGVGSVIGVRLTQNIGFDGDFLDDFTGGGLAQPSVSDTAPLVPGPSALAALIAAGLLGGRKRRRRLA